MGQGFSTLNEPQNCVSQTRIHKQRQPSTKHVILKAFGTESKYKHDFGKVESAISSKNTGEEGRLSKHTQQNISPAPLHIKSQVSS